MRRRMRKRPRRATMLAGGVVALALVAGPVWLVRDRFGPTDADASPTRLAATAPAHSGHGGAPAAPPTAALGLDQVRLSGELTELDKQLLVKVRQANLWELQAGRLAQENASSEAVKRAGLHLLDGHSRLDRLVRELSPVLQVPIPNEPTPEQQQWVQKLRTSKGEEFDRFFANILRVAHGKVFIVVAEVRSTTKNTAIRNLAVEANLAVSDHLQVLEDTGLVEPGTLDEVAASLKK